MRMCCSCGAYRLLPIASVSSISGAASDSSEAHRLPAVRRRRIYQNVLANAGKSPCISQAEVGIPAAVVPLCVATEPSQLMLCARYSNITLVGEARDTLAALEDFLMEGCQQPSLSVSGQVRFSSGRMDTRISEGVRFKSRQVGVSVRPVGRTQML